MSKYDLPPRRKKRGTQRGRERERDYCSFVKSRGVLPRHLTSLWYRKILTKARREPAHIILVTCRLRPAALCPGLQPSAPQIALKHTQQALLPPLWVRESPQGQQLLQDFLSYMFWLLLLVLCWLGSPRNPTHNLIIYTEWRTEDLLYRQWERLHKEKGTRKEESMVMFVFDRWGMPPIDFVREARNRARESITRAAVIANCEEK